MSSVLGLDLGTKTMGIVLAEHVVPLRVLDAASVRVNVHDPEGSAAKVRALADQHAVRDVVVEFGPLYIPATATPQQARAMAENHRVMDKQLDRICAACPGPFYRVTTISRRTWSARVVPHHQGGIGNAEARAGLATWLDPLGAWPLLADQHRVDAAGALVGWLLGPAKAKRRRRSGRPSPPPLTPAEQTALAERRALATPAGRLARRALLNCTCGPNATPRPPGIRGRHPSTCPAAPPPALRGWSEAAAARYVSFTR